MSGTPSIAAVPLAVILLIPETLRTFGREEKLMPISMMIVVGRGYPLAKAKSLAELADAPWVYTGA
jgi:hypothetical protein